MVFQMPDRAQVRAPRRRALLPALLLCAVLLGLLALSLGLWAEARWYESIGYSDVYTVALRARVSLFAAFGALTAALVGGSCAAAYLLRAPGWTLTDESPRRARLRRAVLCRPRALLAAVALLAFAGGGTVAAAHWRIWLLTEHATPFGVRDPQFHRDMSFYVFRLPWYRFLLGFGLAATAVALLLGLALHHLFGTVRLRRPERRMTRGAQLHLALLGTLLLLLKAGSYWMDRYRIAASQSGPLGYADTHALLPAKTVLCCAAVISAVLWLTAPLRRHWDGAVLGMALTLLCSALLGGLYPHLVGEFRGGGSAQASVSVSPYEPAAEAAAGAAPAGGQRSGPLLGATATATVSVAPAAAPADLDDRVEAAAPWLVLDERPYRVTVAGHALWVVDGYTTSDSYPDAEKLRLGVGSRVGYVRDAVKAVLDPRSGRVVLYAWDAADPVLRAWMGAFPGTVHPAGSMATALRDQLRLPYDLAQLQRSMTTAS